jgi:hypothetical protein
MPCHHGNGFLRPCFCPSDRHIASLGAVQRHVRCSGSKAEEICSQLVFRILTGSGHHQIYFGIAIIVAVMAFLAGPP